MKYAFEYSIEIYFSLTEKEFLLLTEAIKKSNEYSYHCDIGGFWYGNMNARNWNEDREDYKHTATTRQLDTVILKSLERYASFHKDSEENKLGMALYQNLFTVLKCAIQERGNINAQQEIKEL